MRILSITAGAAGMYCGSCARDNALAVELIARGHDVTLVPVYTPTRTDEPNMSRRRVLFGGISVYLEQHSAFFRKTPRILDRLWDSPPVIQWFARRSLSTDPRMLGDLTISMLQGEQGVLRKEFEKLLDWINDEPVPDVINLPNSLLIALAAPLRNALHRPVCCTLQGEELFLNGLIAPYREQALDLIKKQVRHVDRFIAVSQYCAGFMSRFLEIPSNQIAVVPLGINMTGYGPRSRESAPHRHPSAAATPGTPPFSDPSAAAVPGTPPFSDPSAAAAPGTPPFCVGYFARLAPEKGLHVLADAYVRFHRQIGHAPARLEVAGYLAPAHEPYLREVRRTLDQVGRGADFSYRGVLDREGKIAFLRGLDVLSVPATYDEPKGVFLLEAMASGVPVVQPRRGAFVEIVEKTGGGLLVEPDQPDSLAEGLYTLWRDRAATASLGQRAFFGVREHYTVAHSADRVLDVYNAVLSRGTTPTRDRPVPVA